MHSEQRNLYIIDKANAFIIKLNHPPPRFHRREKSCCYEANLQQHHCGFRLGSPLPFQLIPAGPDEHTLTKGRFQPMHGQNHTLQLLAQAGQ